MGRLDSSTGNALDDTVWADEVRQWIFEVWNEPNLDIFWLGGSGGILQALYVTARAIKSVSAIIVWVVRQRQECMDSADD